MAHIVIGLVIFAVCTWAVFDNRFHAIFAGNKFINFLKVFLSKHLLLFASIAGAGFAYSGEVRALLTSYSLILAFSFFYMMQGLRKMSHAKMD